ncbi:MAG: phytanoyl-CoA dioxygenase family protein [Bryobacteraceae bacterium]
MSKPYDARGYAFPVPAFDQAAADRFRSCYLGYRAGLADRLTTLPAKDQYLVFSETHLFLHWVYEMITQPAILDAVEEILGPDLMVWNTRWFTKMPGDKTYISWHQDATYWGLHPPNVTTAWLALSESTPENGCMRVIPGSHLEPLLPQVETYAPENALSRGQEIAVAVDESQAVDLTLQPGQMSLHHIGIVHGSKANTSAKPRIGIAVRFITPDVMQEGTERQLATLVRGADSYGHFDLAEPPAPGQNSPEGTIHSEALRRMMTNLMPKDFKGRDYDQTVPKA